MNTSADTWKLQIRNYHQRAEMTPLQTLIVSLLGFVFFTGVPGNILIILVYSRKRSKSSVHVLILALAATDLLVCLVLPLIVYDVLALNRSRPICLLKHYTSAFGVHLSFALSGVISLDRFMAISRPHQRLKVSHAKIIVIICFIVAGITTVPTFITADIMNVLVTPSFSFSVCNVEPTGTFEKVIVLLTYFFTISICIIVGGLYFKLYRIIRNRAKIRTQSNIVRIQIQERSGNRNRADQNNATANITIQTISGSSKTLQSDHGHALSSTSNEGASSSQQPPQIQRQRIGAEGAFQARTNLMLIIVTCVLFISWIPPAVIGIKSILWWKNPQEKLLHMTEKEKWTNVLFQMFFSINHTANAIVYWTVNKHFRQDTLNLLRKIERRIRGRWSKLNMWHWHQAVHSQFCTRSCCYYIHVSTRYIKMYWFMLKRYIHDCA